MKSKNKLVALALVFVLAVTSLSGCAWLDSKIADMKGELIGNSFDISIYDNFGTNILNISGDKVQVDANIVEVQSVDSSGNWSTTYEMSSVTSNTIDGNNMNQTGNTVIYAERGLEKITDFELPTDIETSGGTFNLLDRNINNIKNLIGTPKVVVISSQLGVPIAVYGGEDVYYEIPDDLPKMTKLSIDGKDCVIIHLGDHDPSGIDMSRDIEDRLQMFGNQDGGLTFENHFLGLRRIALNMDQIETFNPPPNPAKLTDSRCKSYMDKYGDESWELDALEPKVLNDLIQGTICEYADLDYMERVRSEVETEKEVMNSVCDDWDNLMEIYSR